MNARIEDARPPRRLRRIVGVAARVLAQGLLLAAGLASTVLGFEWFIDAYDAGGAYRTAPVCGTAAAAPGTDCARHETGKVVAKNVDNSGDSTVYHLTIGRETAPGDGYSVSKEFYYDTEVGADVDLTIWHDRVAEVFYRGHRDPIPSTPWLTSLKVGLLVALGSALTAHGLSWSRSGAPSGVAVGVLVLSTFGSLVYTVSQCSFGVTLGIPVFGWVVMTAFATAAALDY
ncbi:hypothetical protein ATKI12_3857 [Kitasatospora sp. Ki12]|uniref:hypothetical protein n=1 Tax=Kitasatospora xanthocidica TaxID=83382 RepID=UPI00167B6FC5|nr:hypothetical protein [Kitasatospora xanthocidica]GHF85526.1 hypothetical protein GCM10018790_73840 [Kitasatospora xanthocidica]